MSEQSNATATHAASELTAYELRSANGGILMGVFRCADDAHAAIENGDEERVNPVRMVTADGGRTGWLVKHTPWPIWHDVDIYLRERGLAKLSDAECGALSTAASQARTRADRSRHATTVPLAGVITVHGAYRYAEERGHPETLGELVALFCDDADALRAAKDLSDLAGRDGKTSAMRAVTLDGGLSCHLIGDEPPLRIWELAAYLAERGLAKLTPEERAALGLTHEPLFPAILTVHEALQVHVDRGIGGSLVQTMTGVGLFLRASDAQRAARDLCNEAGQDGETRPVRVLTLDGRVGWKLPLAHARTGECEEVPGVAIWRDQDAYLRERARARLTVGERLAVLPRVEPEPGGTPAAPPLVGLVRLYEATQTAERSMTHVVGYFVDKADAERAAKGPDGSGEVKEVPAVTLDGRSAWVLGRDGSTEPLTLWRDVEAHLRHRGLAKLGDEERRAWGLRNAQDSLTAAVPRIEGRS